MNNKENQYIEFKLNWKEDFLKNVCAFANSEGGVLNNDFVPSPYLENPISSNAIATGINPPSIY